MRPIHLALSVLTFSIAGTAAGLAADPMTDAKGMTLYTFDKDTKGTSTCYDACAATWPPYLVQNGNESGEVWTKAKRKDGSDQWAYDGKPLYYYIEDKLPGEAKGDGLNGVWHAAPK